MVELKSSNGMTEVADRTDGQETVVCRAELQGLEAGPGVGLHDGVESGLDLLETSHTDEGEGTVPGPAPHQAWALHQPDALVSSASLPLSES